MRRLVAADVSVLVLGVACGDYDGDRDRVDAVEYTCTAFIDCGEVADALVAEHCAQDDVVAVRITTISPGSPGDPDREPGDSLFPFGAPIPESGRTVEIPCTTG